MISYNLKIHPKIIKHHYNSLVSDFVNERISDSTLNAPLIRFINDNLEDIIMGEPQILKTVNYKFKRHKYYKKTILNKVKKIFDYPKFRNKSPDAYDAYDLAKLLGVRTCLYCNRVYTLTVSNGKKNEEKIIRPQFDHFIDKAENPLLALSIFNLIPSCETCNSRLKGSKKFNLKSYIHPFLDDVINEYKYSFNPYTTSSVLGGSSDLSVRINITTTDAAKRNKINNSKSVFRLEEIMSSHSEELRDLLVIRHHFSKEYLSQLLKTYQGLKLSRDEIYRIIFGVYYDEEDFSKRPFSKLKKDILRELQLI